MPVAMTIPKAFISYSHDGQAHKQWVHDLAARLRGDGIETILDRWYLVPGDRVPAFMETAIRENDFVLIICTSNYKQKADNRKGGVGYEGDIMTAEVLSKGNERKFIPVLRLGEPIDAMPTSLAGKYYIDLRGDPYKEEHYQELLSTLLGTRDLPPAVGARMISVQAPDTKLTVKTPAEPQARNAITSTSSTVAPILPTSPPTLPAAAPLASVVATAPLSASDAFEPIRILGVIEDQVTQPHGSGLYEIPLRLDREPPEMWKLFFADSWDHPSHFTPMHRPGIARVIGDQIVLNGTTIDELQRFHRDTLKVVLSDVNRHYAEYEANLRRQKEEAERRHREQQESVARKAKEIKFD